MRIRNPKIGQLRWQEFASVQRFVDRRLMRLVPVVNQLTRGYVNHAANANINVDNAYPTKEAALVDISSLSSKMIRCNRTNDDPNCLFKLGPALTPGELFAWTKKLKSLTSTRHKNIILRTMHGDIFSNSRLFKFGLRTNPSCSNCDAQVETKQHRLFECPNARRSWEKLEQIKFRFGLNVLTDLSIENLVGAKDDISKLELALQSELILKLSTKSDGYNPEQVVRAAVLLACNSEKLDDEIKTRFEAFKNER